MICEKPIRLASSMKLGGEIARGRGKPMPVPHHRTSYPCGLRQAMRPQTAWPLGCPPKHQRTDKTSESFGARPRAEAG
jgi:hypothetical protein